MISAMKLLIVENDRRVRELIVSVVGDLSDEIFECEDGSEAQAAYTRHLPDWVLMDLMMEGTDGLTATRRIKSVFPDARIVIVTSYDSKSLRETARRAGAGAYVLKENLLELRGILTTDPAK
jgi:CheY-like chemotaxis protein